MDKELIREISRVVFEESILTNWVFYLAVIAVSAVGTYGAHFHFLATYARKRGENLATKADLDDIKARLEVTTEITERIRKEIEHQTWHKQELEVVRRGKLEEHLYQVYVAQENLSTEMYNRFFYQDTSFDMHAANKADMLQMLYFPELGLEHQALCAQRAAFSGWIAKGMEELLAKRKMGELKPQVSEAHMATYPELLTNLNVVVRRIEQKATEIAEKLNTALIY